MTTATTVKIDIPLVLARLRPGSEYHWKGNGYGLYADIGEWRDLNTTKPTEAEVYADWDTYQAQLTQAASDDNTLKVRVLALAQSAVGVQVDQLTAAQVRALLVLILRNAGGLAADGSVKALNTWVK